MLLTLQTLMDISFPKMVMLQVKKASIFPIIYFHPTIQLVSDLVISQQILIPFSAMNSVEGAIYMILKCLGVILSWVLFDRINTTPFLCHSRVSCNCCYEVQTAPSYETN